MASWASWASLAPDIPRYPLQVLYVCVRIIDTTCKQVRDIQTYNNLVFLIRKHIVGQPSEVKALPNALFMLVLPELTGTHTHTHTLFPNRGKLRNVEMGGNPMHAVLLVISRVGFGKHGIQFCCRAAVLWNAQMVTISRTW